eukprot:TRINITY_DN7034_c0_g1_i4.p1 TRINITY_DN7034_c0_g1~~TRINITY_DN7034_c0_g1_i4.p1  ORF type:complete len:387 (-),score=14.65 TRINITY_DN7034_c0_g1_i4:20-1180(-)
MIRSIRIQLGCILLSGIATFILLLLTFYQNQNCQPDSIQTGNPNIYNLEKRNYYLVEDDVPRNGSLSSTLEAEILSHEKADVALCLITRDEHKYIREWIDYHKYIGVNKFYIYDNLSLPPLLDTILDYVQIGLVEYRYITNQWKLDEYKLNNVKFYFNNVLQVNSPQRWAHTNCLLTHYSKHKFLGMIDTDEFIVLNKGYKGGFKPVENPNLPQFLSKYQDTGGLWMYWRIYGTSGYTQSPLGGVLENYFQCEPRPGTAPETMDHKQLINTKFVGNAFCAIHGCFTSKLSVDAMFRAKNFTRAKSSPTWEGININHYMVKSMEDYQNKLNRGGGHSPKSKYQKWRGAEFLRNIQSGQKSNCTFMFEVAKQCCNITVYSQTRSIDMY